MKRPLIILAGPTASGKTKFSIELAKRIGGEIISADSMQVYKQMDIGSAKVRPEEMCGIPHYMIDELEPDEEFNVVKFQQMVKTYMEDIYSRGKIPILAGGTGFYIQAILYDIDFTDTNTDISYRRELEEMAEAEGGEVLHRMLEKIDPKAATEIHPNNVKRVIRALEYHKQTGERISDHNEREKQKQSPYQSIYFVLTDDREKLYAGIDHRVDLMLEQGLVDEVRCLKEQGCTKDMVSMQGLGYKEILEYLNGDCSLEEAVYILKRDTRHFAKRQITWFKREKNVCWIDKTAFGYDDDKIIEAMLAQIRTIL